MKKPIKKPSDVEGVPNIGPRMKEKIKEILETGHLEQADELSEDPQMQALGELANVWGIGPATAQKLYKEGIKTIEDLKEHSELLNKNQQIGLEYYEDFLKKMTRKEAEQLADIVQQTIEEVSGEKDAFEMVICGKYRRGAKDLDDVDVVIARKDNKSPSGLLAKVVDTLHDRKFLTDDLRQTTSDNDKQTYMGVCKHNGLHRRIDIRIYPRESFPFAVLYFTGSDIFQRSMRLYAKSLGYTLSDDGLFSHDGRLAETQGVKLETEKDIFKALGLPYKEPSEREV